MAKVGFGEAVLRLDDRTLVLRYDFARAVTIDDEIGGITDLANATARVQPSVAARCLVILAESPLELEDAFNIAVHNYPAVVDAIYVAVGLKKHPNDKDEKLEEKSKAPAKKPRGRTKRTSSKNG